MANYGKRIYYDAQPQLIRWPSKGNPVTYQQNVYLRFLKPPPIPAPQPLIIREVRQPQPPPPRPLIIRQYGKELPPLPPLVLRERPPPPPKPILSQTIIRHLPPLPPIPRSVIVECFSASPPKPRDIIIERWMPYLSSGTRKTYIERAPAPHVYPEPRNRIIIHEPNPVQVVQNLEQLEVVEQDPEEYIARFGCSLLDPETLLEQARAAGVIGDLSAPKIKRFDDSDSILFDLSTAPSSQGFDPLPTNF